ncbi:glycosyl hydrolase [Niabella drilacis]|uniref:Cellulase (Glycosyl hydrolase family 5) n=1 Tax=Niabella drilacis (strain DSM 25811 / CCM 8410 / CCUG 62505 / LMG 26954 / E90) TaxID=1285928 RepID=A0A1G6TZR6_NIADE|nr:glycosyl hydrolase [Niabella drilacis]SDD33837.1 Cellulase (glycosyl hydrolase family 5) [Niabella drilacis]
MNRVFKKVKFMGLVTIVGALFGVSCTSQEQNDEADAEPDIREVWTVQQANNWYAAQPWYVGADFLPSTAINQLEMWQAETFDTATIDKELAMAESIGMNVMRVYLHDLVFKNDEQGFYDRINKFLEIADRHKIKILFTIFDSCWDPFPKAGKQRDPKPFVHNSGWVQSPGQEVLKDSTQYPGLERYVKALVGKFANDQRIIAWDVWNEPDNMTGASYEKVEIPNKVDLVLPLLKKTFEWARSANPSQPLTSGVWAGNWEADSTLKPIERLQLEESDIVSFHCYDDSLTLKKKIQQLQRYHKPLWCTEYMARPNKSTFQSSLPVAKENKVAMINWGFVDGKSQTIYPWDSWTKTYTGEPPLWFHDIFRKDGSPYKQEEVDFIKLMTGKK